MCADTLVTVQHLSKKFTLDLRRSMYLGAIDVFKSMLGIRSNSEVLRRNEFWAVDDVSFTLEKGQALGVIGSNGSGKSTLLRLLNGIYMPDRGRIEIAGRMGAMIALGAGFHPLMTGRENIYLNGAILGMSKQRLHRQFDEIVAFSEIGEFLDAPVKTYSSGMYVRLGFAIAIQAQPEILLVDEVFAVGDANFQKKCIEKLLRLRESGTALIFISHSMSAVERLCTSCLLMKHGRQVFLGNTRECVQRYFYEISQDNLKQPIVKRSIGTGDVIFSDIFVYQEGSQKDNPNIEFGKNIVIEFKYKFVNKDSNKNQFRVNILTIEGREIQKFLFQESSFSDNVVYPNEKIIASRNQATARIVVHDPKLFPQTFKIDIAVTPLDIDVHLGGVINAAVFNVIHPLKEKMYLEYGNMSINEFDYSLELDE